MRLPHWVTATATVVVTFFASGAAAQTLRVEVGGWDYRLSGDVTDGNPLDFQDDLAVQSRLGDYQVIAGRFTPAWTPMLRFERSPLNASGQQLITTTFGFGPITLFANETEAQIDADLSDLSLMAAYPFAISDTVRAQAGVTLRRLEGPITVRTAEDQQSTTERIDEIFPQIHLGLRWSPAGAFAGHLAGDWIEAGGNEAWTLRLAVDWRLLDFVGLTLGWQHKHFFVRSGRYLLDADFSGGFGGVLFELP